MKEPNSKDIGEKKAMNNGAKEGKKRKSAIVVILALMVIAIAVGVGLTIYNTPSNRLARQLDLGEKYLAEQNYEQAIVEFDKAIAIDPMNERAYIGKAAAYVGMGDYEQAAATYATAVQTIPDGAEVWNAAEQFYLDYAQIYIDDGDYEKAISILEEGYDLLGSEKLHDKIGELVEEAEQKVEEERRASGIVDLPFNVRDITVRGYNLFEDHFAELRGLYPTVEGLEWSDEVGSHFSEDAADGFSGYYIVNTTSVDGMNIQDLLVTDSSWNYQIGYSVDGTYTDYTTLRLSINDNQGSDYEGLSVPVKPGSSYKDWCDTIQIDQIKENGSRPEWDGSRFNIPEEGGYPSIGYFAREEDEYWIFMTDEYRVIYSEERRDDGVYCELDFHPPITERWVGRYIIGVHIGTEGIIRQIEYTCML